MRPEPLHGVRVLDLTRLLPGPMCTLHLADMGADVIKIEDPVHGDYARGTDPSSPPSPFFQGANRNKRGLRLDLSGDAGRAVFMDLAREAHVIVESFRPGVVERLGVGYDAVHALNPRIVYCAITGYGQTGPYRTLAGHDLNYCGYAGIAEQNGPPGAPPALGNFQTADLAGGTLSAAMGILAALFDAQRTGRGRYVDVSMTDCALAHAVVPLATIATEGRTRPRGEDGLTGALACYGVYETADGGYMAVAALEEKFWERFCAAIERPDLVSERMATGERGRRARDAVQAVLRTRSRAEWTGIFGRTDCCVSPVLGLGDAMEDPQLQARGMFVDVPAPDGRTVTQFAFPVKMSEFRFQVKRPAPAPGEHGREILRGLGYDDERIDALERDGVI